MQGSRANSNFANATGASNRPWLLAIASTIAFGWFATGIAIGSRVQLVFNYNTLTALPPWLEFFGATSPIMVACLVAPALLLVSIQFGEHADRMLRTGIGCATIACAPLLYSILRCFWEDLTPSVWELIWFAGWVGMSFRFLGLPRMLHDASHHIPIVAIGFGSILAAIWWYSQSRSYLRSYRLGFNDVGHFAQRVANTAEGRGFLLETPVLPPFWDHFNPGLLLLVPGWKLWPSVEFFLLVQAVSLAVTAWLLTTISIQYGVARSVAAIWGFAWLLHPSVGQMNIAYTYGWHPVTVALPFLLLSYWFCQKGRWLLSILMLLVACSFEEGVIVVVGCFAAAMSMQSWHERLRESSFRMYGKLSTRTWLVLCGFMILSFLLVYIYSGLAPFQKGRFARLGNTPWEIVLSPVLRPNDFWGLFFRPRNAVFVALIGLPLLVSRVWKAPWHVVAIAPPVGVLLVWEHMPAQSMAFQYSSCLLPLLYLGAIEAERSANQTISDATSGRGEEGESRVQKGSSAIACLLVGWILCVSVGQFPWSQPSLLDVLGRTYSADLVSQRREGEEDQEWILREIEALRKAKPRVLATGRIATHFVGCRDVETVAQYLQRREDLGKLDTNNASPILRYDFIVLDTYEGFQQTQSEIEQVRAEALANGFAVLATRYGFEVYTTIGKP